MDLIKQKVSRECEALAGGFPYEAAQVEGETWQELADHLKVLAGNMAWSANRIAGFAGYAQRKANEE